MHPRSWLVLPLAVPLLGACGSDNPCPSGVSGTFVGDVASAEDAAAVLDACAAEIDGYISLRQDFEADVRQPPFFRDLRNVERVTGDVIVSIDGGVEVDLLGLQSLEEVDGDVRILIHSDLGTPAPGAVDLPALRVVGGSFNVTDAAPRSLSGVTALQTVGADLSVGSTISLDGGLSALEEVGGHLTLQGVPSVDALTNLRTVGFFNLLESDVDSLEALAGLESAGGVQIASSHSLTDLRGLGGLRRLPHGLLLTDNARLASLQGVGGLDPDGLGTLSVRSHASLRSLDGLPALQRVEGDVTLFGLAALEDLDALDGLREIGGSLTLESLALTEIRVLPAIESIGRLEVRNAPGLRHLEIEGPLGHLGALQIVGNDSLVDARGFDGIGSLQGDLEVRYNAALVALPDVSGATSAADVFVGGNPELTSLDGLDSLEQVRSLSVVANDRLVDIGALGNLAAVDDFVILDKLPALDPDASLPALTRMGRASLRGLPVRQVPTPALETVDGELQLTDLPALQSLDGLASLTSADELEIVDAPALTDLSGAAKLTALGELRLQGTGVAAIELSSLESVDHIDVSGNPDLAHLDGLAGITGTVDTVLLRWNLVLTDMEGLNGITRVVERVEIVGNLALGDAAPRWWLNSLEPRPREVLIEGNGD